MSAAACLFDMNWTELKADLNRTVWKDEGYQTVIKTVQLEGSSYLKKDDMVRWWRCALAAYSEDDGMTLQDMRVILRQLEKL